MRLIDADKFKENILSGLYVFCQENKEDIARAIDDEPSIIPKVITMKQLTAEEKKTLVEALKKEGFTIIIDNAPTVEPCYQTTSCLERKMYDKANYYCPRFCEVIRSAIEEKPQGKWLSNYTSQFMNPGKQCSLCGKIVEFSENYCPKCGAKMRVKE